MVEVRFHPEAQADYNAALAWYQSKSPRAATRFEAEVERVLSSISAYPEMFPYIDEERRFALFKRFPYRLIYE